MPALIRPNQIRITDRYPMLAFTLQSGEGPRVAEVMLLTDLALLGKRDARNSGNFYSSRESGILTIPASGSVYTVPPQVLARFIGAERLYFALATASAPAGQDWRIDVAPSASSPYVSMRGLTDRALRRVRMYPTAVGTRSGAAIPQLSTWAGDLKPATSAAPSATQPAAQPAPPQPVPYNDGFGPLPPLNSAERSSASSPGTSPGSAAPPPQGAPAAQGLGDVEDERSIDGPVVDEPEHAVSAGLGNPSLLTVADYPGVRLMPSPAWSSRAGTAIDRIVIHITSAPQSPYIGSHFARADANSSAHYMVDQNGAIIQFVREQDKAWHAGTANRRSIGIEHVAIEQGGARYQRANGTWQTFPYTPPTDAELTASAQLVAHLCSKYGLSPDRTTIVGHREADPSTTHSSCPDGAWDWTDYMTRVAAAYAVLPPTGVSAAPPAATSQGLAFAMAAGNATVGSERQPITLPHATAASSVTGRIVETAISAAFPPLAALRAAVEVSGLTIGIGPVVSAGLLAGGALGTGIILAPGNVIGVYGAAELDAGLISSIGAQMQLTIVRGGIAAFNGVGYCAGVSGGEVYTGGAAALFDASRNFCGVTLSIGVGVGLDPLDIYSGVQRSVSTTLGLAQSRSLGDAGTDTVEIKYRAFIPSPAISGPYFDNFHGDGRGFSYSGGTSRGEVTFLVDVGPGGAVSNLRYSDRHWSPTSQYSSSDTYAVAGKPSWWLGLNAGATPNNTATCPTSDDTLRAYIGGTGTTANVLAMAERASIVSVTIAGSNPLLTGSPDIDADVSILLRRTSSGGIEAKAFGSHDGFPAHEIYVNGNSLYTYDPEAADNGPSALLPPEDISVDTSWQSVSAAPATAQGLGLPQAHAMIIDSDDVAKINRLRAGDFRDLFQWRVPQSIRSQIEARGFRVQAIEDAVGDLNLDFYKVRIDRFPPGMDGPALLARFISDTNSFLDSGICSFDPYAPSDAVIRASADPVGACLKLDINRSAPIYDPRGWDDAAIVISDKGPHGQPTQFYSVTTINTPDTGDHPVSGHRQFGFFTEGSATYFYTRGADRATLAFPGTEGSIYAGGEALWQSFQRTTAACINTAGGQATIIPPFSERFNPGAMRAMFGFGEAQAQALDADDWSLNWDDVESIAQPTGMGCWATSTAMILGWKNRQSVSPELLAKYHGYEQQMEDGIYASDAARFIPSVGLQFAPAACYTPEGMRDLLERYGPLFVFKQHPGIHAVVVTGMYRKDGQYFVRVTDPMDRVIGTPGAQGGYQSPPTHQTGSRYIMSYDGFSAEYEAEAGFGDQQIAHGGAVLGRTPNRGDGRAAGYAQGLGDTAAVPVQAPVPPSSTAPDDDYRIPGTVDLATGVTHRVFSEEGRTYDLTDLTGMVQPANAPASAIPTSGQPVRLDEWPYIDTPGGRTQAGIAIGWKYDGAGVGDIVMGTAGGSVADGWRAAVRTEIAAGPPDPSKTVLLIRVITTFNHDGETEQTGINEVTLSGDGRSSIRHIEAAAQPPAGSTPPSVKRPAAAQPVMA